MLEEDVSEFVQLDRSDWRRALLVARNVESKQGKRTDLSHSAKGSKVTAVEFASMVADQGLSGWSHDTVSRLLKAWNKAAKDGLVPESKLLSPGDEVELPTDVAFSYYTSSSSGAATQAPLDPWSALEKLISDRMNLDSKILDALKSVPISEWEKDRAGFSKSVVEMGELTHLRLQEKDVELAGVTDWDTAAQQLFEEEK